MMCHPVYYVASVPVYLTYFFGHVVYSRLTKLIRHPLTHISSLDWMRTMPLPEGVSRRDTSNLLETNRQSCVNIYVHKFFLTFLRLHLISSSGRFSYGHPNRTVQGDHSTCSKPPVDINTKVPFWLGLAWPGLAWPGLACPGQAKAELLF